MPTPADAPGPQTGPDAVLPPRLLVDPAFRAACANRDVGTLFRLARKYAGLSPTRIGFLCELHPTRVGEYITGKREARSHDVLTRVADGLRIPGHLLGLAPRPWEPPQAETPRRPSTPPTRPATSVTTPTANTRLRTARHARQWTQQELADAVSAWLEQSDGKEHHVDVRRVRSWEAGAATWPHRVYRDALTAVFGCDIHALGFHPPAQGSRQMKEDGGDDGEPDVPVPPMEASPRALRVALEWFVTAPPQLTERRTGPRIGSGMLTKVEGRIDELRRLDDVVGGRDLSTLVVRELDATAALARDSAYDTATGRRLFDALAELGQLAGWVTSDAGRHRRAESLYLDGVEAARVSGNAPLAANLLSSLSYQVANTGDPRTAVALAAAAVRWAQDSASSTTRVLLLERLAWAYARAGEVTHCERTLGAAEDALRDSAPANDPAWTYWLDRREMDIMAGRCYVELQRPLRAEPLLREATSTYDVTHAREASLYLTWLAQAYVQANEIEEAAKTATRALELGHPVNSQRTETRLHAIRAALHPHRTNRAVAVFENRYNETTSRRPERPTRSNAAE